MRLIIAAIRTYMGTPLQLEYTITTADQKAAEALQTHHSMGGGPKWRSQLFLWLILVAAMSLLYFRFRMDVKPADRGLFVVLVVIALIFVKWYKRYCCQREILPTKVTVSERELVVEGGGGRVVLPWSGFGKLLEDPVLFLLMDRPKQIAYLIPKRAFPDAAAQDWFRAVAQRSHPEPSDVLSEPMAAPVVTTADGIALSFQLGYRDYLMRNLTSWRMKTIALFLLGAFSFATVSVIIHPDPHAVNSPTEMLTIMLPMLAGMLSVMLVLVSLYQFYLDRHYRERQELVLSSLGFDFSTRTSRGLVPWQNYECYLENRWGFVLWNRQTMWYVLPKRAFASEAELAQCRAWVQANLRRSRWFFL